MSLDLTYAVPGHDLAQLHDALLRAGLVPEGVRDEGDDVFLVLPDGTVEADVDAVVAAHVPQARYDPATLLAARAPLLAANRRRADLTRLRRAAAGAKDTAALAGAVLGVLDLLEREGAQAE